MNPGKWLADRVVAVIAAAPVADPFVDGVSIPFAAPNCSVTRLPRYELKALTELQVCVSDRSRSTSGGGRVPRRKEITLSILFLQKLDVDHTGLEDLIDLVYAIEMLLSLTSGLGWISSNNEPIYDPAALEQEQLFRSALNITFASTN